MLEGKKHVMIFSDGQLKFQAYYDIAEEIIDRGITINDFIIRVVILKRLKVTRNRKKRKWIPGLLKKKPCTFLII